LTWTLERGIELARKLEPLLAEVGWHVALAGSVLRDGKSDKDLDLIVYPHLRKNSARPGYRAMRKALMRAGMWPVSSRREVRKHWRAAGSKDQKWVEVWAANGRVDIFVLS
jgi:hypothetical protein